MRYAIASANGYGNAGDDICMLSCQSIIKHCDKNAQIVVTSPPFDKEAVRSAECIVLGGGGIIYDANKDNMENYLRYVDYGIEHNRKVFVLGVGEQGIVTREGAKRYADSLGNVDLLTVRSKLDEKKFKSVGVKNAIGTQDLAFCYNYKPFWLKARTYKLLRSFKSKPKLGIVISNQEHLVNDLKLAFSKEEKENAFHFRESLESSIDAVSKVYDVTIITQSRDDFELADRYAKHAKVKVYSYKTIDDLGKLLSVYAQQDLIMTQRFHGIIFSLMMEIPFIALGYHGQKQYKLLNDLNLANQLLMYHQPDKIEGMLKALAKDTDKVRNFTVKPSRRTHDYIASSSVQNIELTKSSLTK